MDAFLVTAEFQELSDRLGLTEWTPVVWIGRLFIQDNDFGEHWFDNWDEREALEVRADGLGIDANELMIAAPRRFSDGKDGPCHTPEIRRAFWTDVLKSLELGYELLFEEARTCNAARRSASEYDPSIEDLEDRIAEIRSQIGS